MTKPTGRPRGRPKTKHYVTLMARVPETLGAQVKAAAARQGQNVSVFLRETLARRVSEDYLDEVLSGRETASTERGAKRAASRRLTVVSGKPKAADGSVSDINEELSDILSDTNQQDTPGIPSDMNRAVAETVSDNNIRKVSECGNAVEQHHLRSVRRTPNPGARGGDVALSVECHPQ